MAVGRCALAAILLALVLTGCFPITITTGSGPGATAAPTVPAAPDELTPEERALISHLRATEGPREDLAEATDDDLLLMAQSICRTVTEGGSLDSIIRGLDEAFALSDSTIVALAGGAQVTYCPDAYDTLEWAKESEFFKERLFLRNIREGAGAFGRFADRDAIGYAKGTCSILQEGGSISEATTLLHGMLPTGTAPDPDGAIAFISAAITIYCPDVTPTS
ncbi:DUF732 domain-containing protein [Microbacterium sp.]|uniref:DUF732 domain-containing protein n=1 Tax=Microbacterium sp. TaxID=51671 RepID=UPI0037CA3F7E